MYIRTYVYFTDRLIRLLIIGREIEFQSKQYMLGSAFSVKVSTTKLPVPSYGTVSYKRPNDCQNFLEHYY